MNANREVGGEWITDIYRLSRGKNTCNYIHTPKPTHTFKHHPTRNVIGVGTINEI